MKPSVSGPLTNGSLELSEPGVKCLLKKSFLSVQNPHPGTKTWGHQTQPHTPRSSIKICYYIKTNISFPWISWKWS